MDCMICYDTKDSMYTIGCGNGHDICHDCEMTMRMKSPIVSGILEADHTHRPLVCPMCRVVEKKAGKRSYESIQAELNYIYLEYFKLSCKVTGNMAAVHAQQETHDLVEYQIPNRVLRPTVKGWCDYKGSGCLTRGKTGMLCRRLPDGNSCNVFVCRGCQARGGCRSCM